MHGAPGRISAMDRHSLDQLERLLGSMRFVPSSRMNQRLLTRSIAAHGWAGTILMGAAAVLVMVLVIFTFWRVLLGLRM